MKKILLIVIWTLGANITFSQGNLGDTEEQIQIFFKDMNFTYESFRDINNMNELIYNAYNEDSTLQVIHYLSTDGIVWGTIIYPITNLEFGVYLNLIDQQFVRMEPDEWHNYLSEGVVVIELITEGAERPYFRITYEPYAWDYGY